MNIQPRTVTAQFQNGDLKESKNELYKTKAYKLLYVVKINKTTHVDSLCWSKRGSCNSLKVKSGQLQRRNKKIKSGNELTELYKEIHLCLSLPLVFIFPQHKAT